MTRPERYQLPFDFGQRFDLAHLYYELGFGGSEHATTPSRFVRTVREEILLRSPADAARHFLTHVFVPFDAFDQEEAWLLLLNAKNHVTHEVMLYRGTVDTIHIRLAELFKEAIRVNAPALLLSHLHPSGHAEPSPEDIRMTEQAVQAGRLLGITLLDHLVIGREDWTSLRERGLGFG